MADVFPGDADSSVDAPTTLQFGQTPNPYRTGMKYPVQEALINTTMDFTLIQMVQRLGGAPGIFLTVHNMSCITVLTNRTYHLAMRSIIGKGCINIV